LNLNFIIETEQNCSENEETTTTKQQ